ncbi:hypothetical protein EDB85DRAFT_1887644 [Lactarius pseudohatsudake]|nr:hypothetical protein EDB85DRAFT_1887644 [Lactarius pseudohatsudake]
MSTSNLSLTQDKQILHHHAAMFKKELGAYHACTLRDEGVWRRTFRHRLVFWSSCNLLLSAKLKFMQKTSADYYFRANTSSPTPLRIHLLLLSLMEAFREHEDSLNISSVSENNPKGLSSNYYTSPSNLPPLDIHFPGQNGADPLSDTHVSPLTLAASCRECMDSLASVGNMMINMSLAVPSIAPMASEPQGNSAGDIVMTIPLAAFSLEPMALEPQDTSEEKGNALSNIISKTIITRLAAKRSAVKYFGEAATSATSKTQMHEGDSHPNAHSPQAAMIKDKDKHKLVKAGSLKGARPKVKGKGKQDMMHPCPEDNLDNDWEDEARPLNETREETNEETLPLLTAEGKDNNNIVEQLKQEIQSLKSRCDWQEKTIEDLKSRCDSHEMVLETLRQEIVGLHDRGKLLNTIYVPLVHSVGNPWVTRPLPTPTPTKNPYPGSWVWVPAATGMGPGGSHGYGKPVWVGPAGQHVTSAIRAALNILAQAITFASL